MQPERAIAHGVEINYSVQTAIAIEAHYDSGDPFAHAQVVVYAPNNPTEPWLTGTADEAGRFQFTPDPKQPGNWAVKVRQAGHGDLITIALQPNSEGAMVATAVSGQFSGVQKIILSIVVLWGFLGTALFFAGRRTDLKAQSDPLRP